MFKSIAGLVLASVASADIDNVKCQSIITTGGVWDITDLQTSDRYVKEVTGLAGEKIKFNYCTEIDYDDEKQESFGYVKTAAGKYKNVADDNVEWSTASAIRDADNEVTGIAVEQPGLTECKAATSDTEAVNWQLNSQIMCDESITEKGAAQIVSADVDVNTCTYTVVLKHAAGCPTIDVDIEEYLGWIQENQWVIGIVYLIAGPLIALFGLKWFPYVTASLVAIFVIGLVMALGLAFGWMASTGGTVAVCLVALALGIVAGILIRRNIWLMIGLLGLVAGFFAGTLLFAIIVSISSWDAVWGWWVIAIGMAAIGCVAACYLGKSVVLLSTALVGSYLFMRAWTLFFPNHYPTEAELLDSGSELEVDGIFWLFIGVWAISSVISVVFQCKYANDAHEDLDAYQKA